MSTLIRLSHNVSLLIYHFVCPAKYRRIVFDETVDDELIIICRALEDRYAIRFLEIGMDKDHVHFLIQTVPKLSPSQLMRTIKSITAREIFQKCPHVKKQLWGGEFWTDGYYVNTVGHHGTEETVREYIKEQGREKEYKQMFSQQLELFPELRN